MYVYIFFFSSNYQLNVTNKNKHDRLYEIIEELDNNNDV